jgi:hypothetical protein
MTGPKKRVKREAGGHKKRSKRSRRTRGCCWGLLPYMADFLEGEAGRTACQRIRRHLKGCEKCRMHLDVQMGIIGLYKKWRTGAMPDAVRVRLRRRLDQEMSGGSCR